MIRVSVSRAFLLLAVLGLAACEKASEPVETIEETAIDVVAELNALYHEYDEEHLALNPINATFRGDHRFNDTFGPYDWLSDEYAEVKYDLNKRYLARLLEFDPDSLSGQDRLNYEIFQFDRENTIEREEQGYNDYENLTPVSQFFSVANILPMLGSGSVGQPFETPQHYDDWIRRSSAFVGNVDLSIAKMREGVELGIVQPRVLMEKTLPQLTAQVVESPEQSAFYGPIARMPETFSDEDRERLTAAYEDHIMNVLVPAYAKLHDYINDEYMQHTRETVGQADSPGGKDYYAFMVRETTTTGYTPEEIHEIGKREAERIYAEMERVRDEVGFEGSDGRVLRTSAHRTRNTTSRPKKRFWLLTMNCGTRSIPSSTRCLASKRRRLTSLRRSSRFARSRWRRRSTFPGTPDGSRPWHFLREYLRPAGPAEVVHGVTVDSRGQSGASLSDFDLTGS